MKKACKITLLQHCIDPVCEATHVKQLMLDSEAQGQTRQTCGGARLHSMAFMHMMHRRCPSDRKACLYSTVLACLHSTHIPSLPN